MQQELCELIKTQKAGHHIILSCDTNGHHTIWESADNNERNEELVEFVVSANINACRRLFSLGKLGVGCI